MMDNTLFYYHVGMLSLGIISGKPEALESAKFLAIQNLSQEETNIIVNNFINYRKTVKKDNIDFVNVLCNTLQLKEKDIISFAYEFEKNKDNYKAIKESILKLEQVDVKSYPQYVDIFNEVLSTAIMLRDETIIEYLIEKMRGIVNE